MKFKYVGIIIVVLLTVIGGYFFLRGDYQTPGPVETQAPIATSEETAKPTETSPATKASISQVTEISVAGTEFSFSPASVSVKAGERVKITFSNKGRAPHNLILEGLGIATETIGGGQTDVVEFTAPSSGTYVFSCSVPGHKESGMKGSLKVE